MLSNNKNQILLVGGYDTKNIGDYASLKVLIQILKKTKFAKKLKINFLSRKPSKKFDKQNNLKSYQNFEFKNKKLSFGKFFNGFNYFNENNKVIKKIFYLFQTSKIVIIGNGRLFSEISFDFMRGPLFYYFLIVYNSVLLRKPVFIFSHTILKLKNKFCIKLLKFIIQNSKLVILREKESLDNLKKMGITYQNVKVLPDACFALNEQKEINLPNNLKTKATNSIILNVRGDLYCDKKVRQMIDFFSKLADFFYKKTKKKIILINQKTYKSENLNFDDRHLNKIILGKSKNKKNITFISQELNLEQTLYLYKLSSFVVTMRRHGFILAMSQKTPCFSVVDHLGTNYALRGFDRKKNSISINNFFDTKKNILKIYKAYNDRNIMQKKQYRSYLFLKKNLIKKYSRYINKILHYE